MTRDIFIDRQNEKWRIAVQTNYFAEINIWVVQKWDVTLQFFEVIVSHEALENWFYSFDVFLIYLHILCFDS